MSAKPVYTVQVRELVEFALRRGDLGGERMFTGPGRALAGTRGHQRIQKSRPAGYQKEVSVSHDVEAEEFIVRIQGRIDGLMVTAGEVLLEEIKTVQGAWDKQAESLHWDQAEVYAFIYLEKEKLASITVRLTYLELDSGNVTEFNETFSRQDLAHFFEAAVAVYLEWIREWHRWRLQRDDSIRSLDFPFSGYRPGQREMAVAAYRTLAGGGRLFVEAPTGIGKTISVLFPALKAMAEGKLERIFYLTARTVGRAVAEKALEDLRQPGLRLRSITLTAKEKLCVRDGARCDPATCPLCKGYYDRRLGAMRTALDHERITRPILESIGNKHQVCPFELSLDLSSWVDAVICDYNYVFDPRVYLRRHFDEERRDHGFLIDEAHNLPDRAREMFSANLETAQINDVKRSIQTALPKCAKALARLGTAMRRLGCGHTGEPEPWTHEGDLFEAARQSRASSTAVPAVPPGVSPARINTGETPGWTGGTPVPLTQQAFPEELLPLLDEALETAETFLARNQAAEFREDLLELYFRLHSFRRTAEIYDEHFVTIIEAAPATTVRFFCLDPSDLLRQALERGRASVFFSATLTPLEYYRSLLGGNAEDPTVQLPSPFPSENLAVLVQNRIRTDFKAREETLPEVAEAIAALVRERRGNYLIYFPSYQYLASVQAEFEHHLASLQKPSQPTRVLAQRPGMTEAERELFLAEFSVEHGETLVGFAVMGGIFGEGIDLVGDKLIGAVIVGVGLPQLCVERDLIRNYFQEKNGAGFEFAYTFPGMNRVLQAVGRVIRSENDRGVALLIDVRFGEARYRRLFPAWWRAVPVRGAAGIQEAVENFWSAS